MGDQPTATIPNADDKTYHKGLGLIFVNLGSRPDYVLRLHNPATSHNRAKAKFTDAQGKAVGFDYQDLAAVDSYTLDPGQTIDLRGWLSQERSLGAVSELVISWEWVIDESETVASGQDRDFVEVGRRIGEALRELLEGTGVQLAVLLLSMEESAAVLPPEIKPQHFVLAFGRLASAIQYGARGKPEQLDGGFWGEPKESGGPEYEPPEGIGPG